MKNKEAAQAYMTEFITARKGVERVSEETGIHRATIRQLFTGRNAASQKTIDRFAEVYGESFDEKRAAGLVSAPAAQEEEIDWKGKYFELEGRFSKLESAYAALSADFRGMMSEYKDLLKQMVKDGVKLSFNSSGSHTTADPVFFREPIGYEYGKTPTTEGKVLVHPAARVIRLNSLQVAEKETKQTA